MADDLDQLLDSALDDFTKLDVCSIRKCTSEVEDRSGRDDGTPSSSTASVSVQGLGTGMGLPGPRKGKKEKRGKQSASPNAGLAPALEALEKLTQQTREAVIGIGTATTGDVDYQMGDLNQERMVEEFVKEFEQMSGSQDMESIVETMMQQLLSKEILHEPMKEIAERYPKWLEDHKEDLDTNDYDRYSLQYELIVKLNDVYDNDPDNFPRILELMQKMQDCGQPPSDVVQELAPGLDLANLGNGEGLFDSQLGSSPNCSIM